MPSLPSRKSLENLKRVDLQKLCKDYGVKANLKSEALIDLLLDTQKPAVRSTRRSVSTRVSSRPGSSRISSVIIHDTDDDDQDVDGEMIEQRSHAYGHDTQEATHTTPPATRARKAKEQTRLGVGRPVAAGGSGPRAVTKSLSVAKGKPPKASKSMKQTEDTIPEEEPELEPSTELMQDMQSTPQDVQKYDSQGRSELLHAHTGSGEESLAFLATIDKHVADALRPLYEQVKSLKSELELMQSLRVELGQLKTEVADIGTLKAKVEALSDELQTLRVQATSTTAPASEYYHSGMPEKPTSSLTPSLVHRKETIDSENSNSAGSDSVAPEASVSSSHHNVARHPGIAPTMLGKRQRDSVGSNMTGIVEEGPDDELAEDDPRKSAARPARKRAKMADKITTQGNSMGPMSCSSQDDEKEETPTTSVPTFTVFRGESEPSDLHPPNNSHSDLFPPTSGAGHTYVRQGPAGTSSAYASENQQPFSFSFVPMSSTPAHSLFMPSFPYPEPPQSPSPAGIHPSGFLNPLRGDPTGMFQPFGSPNSSRSSRSRPGSNIGGGFVDPAALTRHISDRDLEEIPCNTSANDMAMESSEPGPSSSGGLEAIAGAPLMKRTMYGTELDGDTRFGDFGLEGVGGNGRFWTGGRY